MVLLGDRPGGGRGAGRARGRMRAGPALLVAILAWAGAAVSADAGDLSGRVALETDFLGESYYSNIVFTGLDLGLPSGSTILFTQVTDFDETTWLPGPRLDLGWRSDPGASTSVQAASVTSWNTERFSQEAELGIEGRNPRGARWRLRASGAFRDDDRSLVGRGDWETRMEGGGEVPLARRVSGGVLVRWDHSRSRGDSSSYLYDYDAVAARLVAAGRGEFARPWETWVEGSWKQAEDGDVGSYGQVRAGGWWRPASSRADVTLDLRIRDYAEGDTVGRDGALVEAAGRLQAGRGGRTSWDLEAGAAYSDYVEEDDLYFDAVELRGDLRWRRAAGDWTLRLGPGLDWLEDLRGGTGSFLEGRLRSEAASFFGRGGFVDIALDGGYRDYRTDGGGLVEITSVSASFLRSDYWLLELLIAAGIPLPQGMSLDATLTGTWEFHTRDSERLRILYANVAVARRF